MQKYNYANYMQVAFIRMMSKIEYLNVPTRTKLKGRLN